MKRTFTLNQAREMLPSLKKQLLKLRETYSKLFNKWQGVATSMNLTFEDPLVRDVCLADSEIRELANRVEKELKHIEDQGVECKGIEQGLLDFPCLLEDRMVYLCWQIDEEDITQWHELDEGFQGRKSLFEAISKNREVIVN